MADFPTRLDLYAIGRDYVTQRARKIDPVQVDISGSDINLFVGIASYVGSAVVLALVQSINSLLLNGAYREDLDRYALDRYSNQVPRKGAAAARGFVTIARPTAAAGAGSIPLGTRLLTLSGVEYTTVADVSMGGAQLTLTNVPVRAAQAGKSSQTGANTIRLFGDLGALWDQTLTVTNPERTANGEDAEEDDVYRERIRAYWGAAQRGTLAAIEFGARKVPGITSALAEEVIDPTDPNKPARVVNLYIADSSGVASAAIAAEVLAELREWRAGGIAVIVNTSVPVIVDVQLHLTFAAAVDTASLTGTIRAAVADYINNLGVGQTLYRAAIYSVLQRYTQNGLIVNTASVVSPAGDVVPEIGQALRTRYENVVVV